MKDTIEKAIIETAIEYAETECIGLEPDELFDRDQVITYAIQDFTKGAKSDIAKKYHTQGMYSEEEVKEIAGRAYSMGSDQMAFYLTKGIPISTFEKWFNEWFEQYKKNNGKNLKLWSI